MLTPNHSARTKRPRFFLFIYFFLAFSKENKIKENKLFRYHLASCILSSIQGNQLLKNYVKYVLPPLHIAREQSAGVLDAGSIQRQELYY